MSMFAVKTEDGKEGRDGQPSVGPIYRNVLAEDNFPPLDTDLITTWNIFRASVEKYPGNRMLGWREFIDGKWGPYAWKTYEDVYNEVLHAGAALRACGIEPGSRVGIYGSNCPQWIVAMEACGAHSLICVPLYDTLGPGAVNYILDHAEIDVVFVQDKKVNKILDPECTHAQRLKSIVSFTSLTEAEKDGASSIGIKSYSWNDFLHMFWYLIIFVMTEDSASVGFYHGSLLSKLPVYIGDQKINLSWKEAPKPSVPTNAAITGQKYVVAASTTGNGSSTNAN